MFGASKLVWPLALLAALPLLLSGCGSNSDPNAATQFRPVDDEPAQSGNEAVSEKANTGRPAVKPGSTNPANKATGAVSPSGRSPATKGMKPGNDPALAGTTTDKVLRIRSLMESLSSEPPGATKEEKIENLFNQLQQVVTTADEVTADEKAPAEARDEASLARDQALLGRFQVASMMLKSGAEKDAKEILSQAAADLAKQANNPQYSTLGRVQLFKIHVMDVLQLQPEDAKEVLTALDTLLEAGGDSGVITEEVVPLIMQLARFGYAKESVAGLAKIGDHFAASKEPKEAIIGKQLQVRTLVEKLNSGEGDSGELGDQIVAKSREILKVAGADEGGIILMHQLANGQQGDHPDVSGKLYDLIEETYAEHRDPKLAEKAKDLVASGRQRLDLVGKPLTITGVLVGGDPFDWSEYQGKVVLVHFWALSSEPSLQDLSSKLRLHGKYQRRGLNLVGINLDEDTKHVEELFEAQKVPWPTLTAEDPAQRGSQHPAAKACGVTQEALPFTVLVGKDGNVVAAGLQGTVLDEAIVKLLTAEDDEPKEKTEDKPKEPDNEAESDAKPDESK